MTNSSSDVLHEKDAINGNNSGIMANSTSALLPIHHMQKIFLQTSAAQGIAGAFAFAALILTCWQVNLLFDWITQCNCAAVDFLYVSFVCYMYFRCFVKLYY